MGLVAPHVTPPQLVRRLSEECGAVLKVDELVAKLKSLSFTPSPTSPEEFAHGIAVDHQRWSKVLQVANLKLD
jgi:tripartite-type tricarboxylate transporter receptor subunit TctC